MKVGKPKSKRVPVRLRHKIEKASAAKQKKARKEAKKNPQWRSRLKKDPGIPNLFPYKDKILSEIEEGRRKKEEEVQRRREIAKAQRNGTALAEKNRMNVAAEADDDDDGDQELEDFQDAQDGDEIMEDDNANPMAALLASAEARAQSYSKDGVDEDEEADDDDDGSEWGGIDTNKPTITQAKTRKAIPSQALADPIKAVTKLLDRLQKTQEGMQQLLDYYQIPPLVTAGSDTTSRFLVDVARKRGRLGRGGVPNLHSAALTVLSDINEERVRLPALEIRATGGGAAVKGDVQIVAKMAEPFRIDGLFNDDPAGKVTMEEES